MSTARNRLSPAIEPLVAAWLAEKQSDSTSCNYARALSAWRAFLAGHTVPTGSRPLDLWDANADLVHSWQQSMRDSELSVATINHALSSVSSFYAYAIASHAAPAHLVRNPIGVDIRREAVDAFQGVQPSPLPIMTSCLSTSRITAIPCRVRVHTPCCALSSTPDGVLGRCCR